MPLVLTSSLESEFQGPTFEDLKEIAPEAYEKRVKRAGVVNCRDDPNLKSAVEATGRKKLIMAGLTNQVCIVMPSISATEEGYEVQVVNRRFIVFMSNDFSSYREPILVQSSSVFGIPILK